MASRTMGETCAQSGHSRSSNSMITTFAPLGGLNAEVSLNAVALAGGIAVCAPAGTTETRAKAITRRFIMQPILAVGSRHAKDLLLPLPFCLSFRSEAKESAVVFAVVFCLSSFAEPGSPASGLCSLGWDGGGSASAVAVAFSLSSNSKRATQKTQSTFQSGSLFLKSNPTLEIPQGGTLIGSQRLEDSPLLPTRIAGIEMPWPAALINTRDQHNITITGKGTIDGDGPIWWKSYWDLRAQYEPKGLRWASDYDARRPRLILFQNSSDIHLTGGLLLKRSGFWTVQILYSHNVIIDGVVIRNNEGGKGPSTDGIDIASPRNVPVAHADIDVNDDALCLKAGRDSDGLRVNRPTEDVVLRDSIIRHGAAAVTIGSETSGGFRNIEAYNLTALSGVPSGVLFKSAHTRGGSATDIRIHDLNLHGVAVPIHMTMNWNPSYSYATLPPGVKDPPPYWVTLTTKVPEQQGLPHFRNVHIWNIKATGARRA